MVVSHASEQTLRQTPLRALHAELGARMVAFAGYEMPMHFARGILKEHLHTRSAAGLFDISHMGQIVLRSKSGDVRQAAAALEALVPSDLLDLPVGRQRYGLLTTARGGILDDLMVSHRGADLLLIVNAARKADDESHLRAHLSASCEITKLDHALIALQGPAAEKALAALAPACVDMRFMDARELTICDAACFVTRSGYTGEDGFEISIPSAAAAHVARQLLAQPDVLPIGLGARDSLRLEAGLPLYGHDIDETTTPVEAQLDWAISRARRRDGVRAGGFPGAPIILAQLAGRPARVRVGLKGEGRMPIREGSALYREATGGEHIGTVTSGGFGPSVSMPISMAYIPSSLAVNGNQLYAEVRAARVPVHIVPLPFVPRRYKRS